MARASGAQLPILAVGPEGKMHKMLVAFLPSRIKGPPRVRKLGGQQCWSRGCPPIAAGDPTSPKITLSSAFPWVTRVLHVPRTFQPTRWIQVSWLGCSCLGPFVPIRGE